MTHRLCHRFVRTDLQDRLLDEVLKRGMPHSVSADGTICSDNGEELDDLVCDIYSAEIGVDWVVCQTDDKTEERRWREYLANSGLAHIEEIQDGETWFTIEKGTKLPG